MYTERPAHYYSRSVDYPDSGLPSIRQSLEQPDGVEMASPRFEQQEKAIRESEFILGGGQVHQKPAAPS